MLDSKVMISSFITAHDEKATNIISWKKYMNLTRGVINYEEICSFSWD
jgi:hypothetical protein